MERAHRKALMTLRNPAYAVQEREFESVYGPAAVRKDKALALHKRSLYDKINAENPQRLLSKKMAEVFEAVVLEESELSGWLGENATTLKTTDYDDFENYIDMIAEWHKPGEGTQVLALGVDATFGTGALLEKFQGIRKGIESDTLASIRYFKDTRGDFVGTRNNVPRTVIGVSQPVVEELGNLWVNGKKKELAEHPVQRVILVQMRTQLESQLKFAQRLGQTGVADAITNALSVIRPIERSKAHMPFGKLIDDPVAREISRHSHAQFDH